jgi:hypothetical protein
MEIRTEFLLESISNQLQNILGSVDKLSRFTNLNVAAFKVDIKALQKDVEQLQKKECPRSPDSIKEIIKHERLAHEDELTKHIKEVIEHQKLVDESKSSDKLQKRILWALTVIALGMSIILGFKEFIM